MSKPLPLPDGWKWSRDGDGDWQATCGSVTVQEASYPSDGRLRTVVGSRRRADLMTIDGQGNPVVPSAVYVAVALANGHMNKR